MTNEHETDPTETTAAEATVDEDTTEEEVAPEGKTEPRRRSVVGRVISTLFGLGMIPLVLLAVARIFRLEETSKVMLPETFTPLLFLPAYVVLVFAAFTRRRAIGAIALALVICHLVWTVPELRPATSLPAAAANAPTLKLFSQNLKYDNETPDAVVSSIRASDADVVFLQEFTPDALNAIKNSGVLDAYTHSTVKTARGPQGIGLYSKLPLDSSQINQEFGMPAIRVTITKEGHQLVLWNIHTVSPPAEGGPLGAWMDDLGLLETKLHAETGNVIVAGDFNAVWSHRPYRDILTNGYKDVHVDRGRGYARTWPNDRRSMARFGGIIRIDHVLMRGTIRAKSIEETPAAGSDHRGTLTTFALIS